MIRAILGVLLLSLAASSCALNHLAAWSGTEVRGPQEPGGSLISINTRDVENGWKAAGLFVGFLPALAWDVATLLPQWALGFFPYGETWDPH